MSSSETCKCGQRIDENPQNGNEIREGVRKSPHRKEIDDENNLMIGGSRLYCSKSCRMKFDNPHRNVLTSCAMCRKRKKKCKNNNLRGPKLCMQWRDEGQVVDTPLVSTADDDMVNNKMCCGVI
jgi:hypothetical protein